MKTLENLKTKYPLEQNEKHTYNRDYNELHQTSPVWYVQSSCYYLLNVDLHIRQRCCEQVSVCFQNDLSKSFCVAQYDNGKPQIQEARESTIPTQHKR